MDAGEAVSHILEDTIIYRCMGRQCSAANYSRGIDFAGGGCELGGPRVFVSENFGGVGGFV